MKRKMVHHRLILIIAFFTTHIIARHLWEVTELNSVTHFIDFTPASFYQSLWTQKSPNTPPRKPKDNNVKRKICKSIFDNPSFRLYAENWTNVDPKDIREELKENHSVIFNRIFIRRETILDENHHEYENRYRILRVRFGHASHVEYTFICLIRNHRTREIKEYYVTQEYNVNLVVDAPPIAGRFVILSDPRDDGLQVLLEAAAEEPAHFTLGTLSSEVGYVNVRKKYSPTPVAAMDPICTLPQYYKLRLCASIFAAHRFKNKIKFLSDMHYVQPVCEKKEVSISPRTGRLTQQHLHRDGRRIYDEWIIGCTALTCGDNEPITYYVSRGIGPNTVFVYTRSDGHGDRVSLYGLASNVSVADFRARAIVQDGRYLIEDVEN